MHKTCSTSLKSRSSATDTNQLTKALRGLFLWADEMTTIRDINQRRLDDMALDEVIEFIASHGFSTDALSNETIWEIAISILDGHEDDSDLEELNFDAMEGA